MKHLLATALAALTLAACSSAPIEADSGGSAAVEERMPGVRGAGGNVVQVPRVSSVNAANLGSGGGNGGVTGPGQQGQDVRELRGVPTKRAIYFDYDSFSIKDEYKPAIESHAKFLAANPRVKMLIQGNADERGSREYNLALGQKRADVVKSAIVVLGAREDQLEAVSLGEEKPRNLGHDEAAYAENRRSDILYSGEF